MTSDPRVAKSFAVLRRSYGSERRGKSPTESVAVPCRLTYKLIKEVRNGVVFRAGEMEEKWDIDLFDDELYISRSWTGELIFVTHLHRSAGLLTVSEVSAPVSSAEASTMIVRDVDFLIKTFLLGLEVPHSLPHELPSSEKMIVTCSFSLFGRHAAFATYDDTTKFEL